MPNIRDSTQHILFRNNQIACRHIPWMTMKLKAKIVGPKVQDVGYRYFLMSMAMSNRIRMFEAHNIESNEVWAFVDGDDEAVKAFRAQAEIKRPAKAEVSGIFFVEEIKGLREDVQPGYSTNFRQLQVDVRAIKQQLGML